MRHGPDYIGLIVVVQKLDAETMGGKGIADEGSKWAMMREMASTRHRPGGSTSRTAQERSMKFWGA